ncbi:MAG: hypothetical protein CBD63_03865, partial [Candidatus Pelagibacter sp. TMED203]
EFLDDVDRDTAKVNGKFLKFDSSSGKFVGADANPSTESIQDIIGDMVSSNTESGITVTYQDGDGTLDFTVGTLNQDTTGNAATATALATARTIHGVSFDGSANIDLSEVIQDTVGAMFGSNTETGITVTYQDSDGTIDLVVGTLNQDTTGNAATATALATARNIGGVSFDGTANINLPGVNTSGDQDTSGNAATATALATARTINGTSFDGTANVTVTAAAGTVTGNTLNSDVTASSLTSVGTLTTLTVDNIVVNGTTIGHTDDTDLITLADGVVTVAGEISVTTLDIGGTNVTSTAAELNILDGVTSTAAELNIMDGNTSASSTTVADADRVVFNDAGTMKQVAVTDLAAYFDDEITAMPNLITTAATTVGALDSGSITSGFGTIDTGSSTITTTGLITGGSLDIDDVVINGTTIGHTDDTDLLTVANGLLTVAGEISVTTLDIGGTNVTSTAAELNLLDGVSGLVQADFTKLAAVDSTAAELNIVDGGTSATSTTLADADRVVVNDNGTMVQVALTDFETYFESALDTLSNVTTVGTLNSGAISSGFGNIDIGSSNLTATGTISLGATSFNDNDITNVGDIALDSISADGTDINVAVSDNSGTAFTIKQGSDAYLIVDTGNSSESVSIGTGISGTAITLGHSTSEVTVADNLTVTGDLTVSGTTTTVNSTTVNLNDHNIVLDSGNSTSAVINGAGITIEGGSGDDATFTYNTTGPQFELKLGSSFESLKVDQLIADSLDIENDVDINGTLEADAITVNGTALNTVIAGVTVTNATNSAHVLVTDNESTNEENLITFVEGATSSTGNVGLEMDGNLTYNPSTGRLTATQLAGTLQTAAQANVTSLGTLTTLTVDNVIINGTTIGHTDDTDLITLANGVVTVGGTVTANDITLNTGANSLLKFQDSTGAQVYQIKGNVSDSADFGLLFEDGDGNDIAKFLDGGECLLTHNHNTKLQTTSSGVSITGEVDATSLDISGDADIDGTLEADAITVNGTALNTVIADEATALAIALG